MCSVHVHVGLDMCSVHVHVGLDMCSVHVHVGLDMCSVHVHLGLDMCIEMSWEKATLHETEVENDVHVHVHRFLLLFHGTKKIKIYDCNGRLRHYMYM